MIKEESIFVKCDCGCGILEIANDDFSDNNGQFYFASWVQHPGNCPMSKKERIRWCAHVMKTGEPWADHTIVNKRDALRIIKFLTKKLKEYGKKTPCRK